MMIEKLKYKVWSCKIGSELLADLPDGADLPMRLAIKKAFEELTGHDATFCFSGWNGKLDDHEREFVEDHPRKY